MLCLSLQISLPLLCPLLNLFSLHFLYLLPYDGYQTAQRKLSRIILHTSTPLPPAFTFTSLKRTGRTETVPPFQSHKLHVILLLLSRDSLPCWSYHITPHEPSGQKTMFLSDIKRCQGLKVRKYALSPLKAAK